MINIVVNMSAAWWADLERLLNVVFTRAQMDTITCVIRHARAIVIGFISLVIVVGCMTTQMCMAVLFFLDPGASYSFVVVAIPVFWCTVLILPATIAFIGGMTGTPCSWGSLLEALWKEPLSNVSNYVLTMVVPRIPFLSRLYKQLNLEEECKLFEPPDDQLENADVKDEIWIYINGIATTRTIGEKNCHLLYDMFSRPIHHLLNPTDGIGLDLLECMADKVGIFKDRDWASKPLTLLVKTLKNELREAKRNKFTRVVLIAHSQGTIIAGKALYKLEHDAPGDPAADEIRGLMKELLEVYCIANCAHVMPGRDKVKVVESLSNGRDTIAYLGQLFPFPWFWQDVNGNAIQIDECIKVQEPLLWGHLLNTHYLNPMLHHRQYCNSQLVRNYMGGRRPRGVIEAAGNPAALLPNR
jgi:hypothetical protein